MASVSPSHYYRIVGAGPVGLSMAMLLKKAGYSVSVYEKRKDPRNVLDRGRSINLALSDRGFRTLALLGLEETIKKEAAIPMKGRMIHTETGEVHLQPYSQEGKTIFSVSRGGLNNLLLDEAEKRGISVHFEHRLQKYMVEEKTLVFENGANIVLESDASLLATDGAFSALRQSMKSLTHFEHSEVKLDYAYKELTIPAFKGTFALEKNALHIWPRKSFMLIALPNTDGSFTCTLFLKQKGDISFEQSKSLEDARQLFLHYFPDALEKMPLFEEDWALHPVSNLYMETCSPWNIGADSLLLGDAAHAIVPFYGQGLNAGLEDARLLYECINRENNERVFENFQCTRRPDTDAIGQLALQNFIEMRDLVTDEHFLRRGKLEGKLKKLYPSHWLTQYEMVTFSHLPYSIAQEKAKENQKKISIILENELLTRHLLDDEVNEQDMYLLSLIVL